MADLSGGSIKGLYTYPIKGLSALELDHVSLSKGNGFPGDRVFGFAKANSGFDPKNPQPLPKDRFLVLMQYAKLAGLETSIDPKTLAFEIKSDGEVKLSVNLSDEEGEALASAFFTDLLNLWIDEKPFFAEAHPHRFTDVSVVSKTMMNAVSLISCASIRDFEEKIDQSIDPLRFRGNIVFDGWPAFSELELEGRTIKVGDVTMKVLLRTKRCAATEVNPTTAERDIKVPMLLRKTYGHFDMGIYAEVMSDGIIKPGDSLAVVGS